MTWDRVVRLAAAAVGAVGGFLGGWNPMLTVLAVCIIIDYLTGIIVAAAGRSPKSEAGGISSNAGFKGLLKKSVILLVVLLATVLDRAAGTAVFQSMTVCYYVANEGISILENAVIMDVPVPDALKTALEVMREKNSTTKETAATKAEEN